MTEEDMRTHHIRCPWHPDVDPKWLLDPASQEAYALAVQEKTLVEDDAPTKGSEARKKAVRDHVKRVAAMTHAQTGKTPEEIRKILTMPNPECSCDNPKPRHAHNTWICGNCGGIAVPEMTPEMMAKLQQAAERKVGVDPQRFPKDSLGCYPEAFQNGEPIECIECAKEGKHVYARYAKVEKQVWCPRGHTPKPASMKFTRQLVRRGRKRAKA